MAHALSKLPVQQLTNCGTFHRGRLPLLQSVEARAACSWRLPTGLERPARVVADSCAITLGVTTRVATKSPAVFCRLTKIKYAELAVLLTCLLIFHGNARALLFFLRIQESHLESYAPR